MLSALLLSFAVINFTGDLGGASTQYPHSQRVFMQTSFNQAFANNSGGVELLCNFNVTCLLNFNTTSEVEIKYESFELDSYVNVYDSNFDIINTYHYDNYINTTITSTSLSSIEYFSLVPENSANSYYYLLQYDTGNGANTLGSYFIPNLQGVYADYSNSINFVSENFVRSMYFVMNSVLISSKYQSGFNDGYNAGYNTGISDGYQTGYTDGFDYADNQDTVALTIFTGICEVGLLPVNVFLGILNFEVFGINIGGFVASLMTIAIVVIVIRVVLGARSKE